MSAKLVIAIATVSLTTVAMAQTNSSAKKPANSAEGASNSSATSPLPGNAATQPQIDNPASGGGTSTQPMPAMATTVEKKPYKITLWNRANMGAKDLAAGDGAPTGNHFLQGSYNLSETKSIGARQEFSYKFPKAGSDTKGEGHISDFFVSYTDSDIAKLPFDFKLSTSFRAYLPTGEGSRFTHKRKGAFYAIAVADRSIGKFDFFGSLYGIYHNQSQNGYMNDKGELTANADYEVWPYATVAYNVSPELQVWNDIGMYETFYRPAAGENRNTDYFTETAIAYKVIKNVEITASVYNEINVSKPKHSFSVFRGEETTYRLALDTSI